MPKEEYKRVTRGMPYNVDAETNVLGSILIDGKTADLVVPLLNAEDFYLEQNRTIFAVMKQLQSESKPIDVVSVSDALEIKGQLDRIGSVAYLSELAEGVVSAANGEYYAQIVKRDSLTRKVITAGNEIAKYGYECEEGKDALANAEKLVYSITEQSSESALKKVDDAVAAAIKNIQDVQSGNVPKNTVYTDFPSFDAKTHGLKPGEMVLIAARPSVGKTAFALNIAANVALNHGKKVAIFSLEMPSALLAKRMLGYISKVSFNKMDTRGALSGEDYKKIMNGYKALLASGIYIDDYSMNGPSDVLSKCRRLKREQGLDLVIIDYLQLMTSKVNGRVAESRQVEVSDMSRKMKIYAKELECPIILLSQMSRGVEQRNDHTPLLSDLRESGSIEQDADVVAFLNNPHKYNPALPEHEVILDVKKNRNGPIGEIKLDWDGSTTTFKEIQENGSDAPYSYAEQKDGEEKDKVADIKSISQVAEEMREVASDSQMPFDMPFANDDAPTDAPFEAPAPSDDDAPMGADYEDQDDYDDEYVDEGDEYVDADEEDMPF